MRDVVPFPLASVLGLCLIGCALALGCAKQGAGERCDRDNADQDCEPGLVCRGESQLSIKGRGVALCCPIAPGAPTVDACRAGSQLPSEMMPPPSVDAGPVPPVDAGNDAAL